MTLYCAVASEDELSEIVAEKLVRECVADGEVAIRLRKGGNGYLRTNLDKFRQISNRMPLLLLTDLDTFPCASALLDSWLAGVAIPDQFKFRVCVREIEAWLMADRQNFANLLEVPINRVPASPDELADPKRTLLQLARQGSRAIRSDLLVQRGAVASQGLGYNRRLADFVTTQWNLVDAAANSNSLSRAVGRLQELAA